jgi:glutathione synthase/RimK-type ligase-like ATP-grasp enzyme
LNNSVAYKFAGEKKLTYFMLEREHIKVPHSVVISENTSFPEILEILKINQLSFPLVVKPAV